MTKSAPRSRKTPVSGRHFGWRRFPTWRRTCASRLPGSRPAHSFRARTRCVGSSTTSQPGGSTKSPWRQPPPANARRGGSGLRPWAPSQAGRNRPVTSPVIRPRLAPIPSAVLFTINAFAISWLCWLPLVAANREFGHVSASTAPVLILLGTFGPFFSAVAIVGRRSGFRGLGEFLGQAFRWRAGIRWYVAALVAPAAIRIVVLYVHVLKGGTFPDLSDPARWLAIPWTFLMVLLIGGPTGEEFGWRGFLLQRVQPVFGLLWASIGIGVVTAFWHLPLFWIPGT